MNSKNLVVGVLLVAAVLGVALWMARPASTPKTALDSPGSRPSDIAQPHETPLDRTATADAPKESRAPAELSKTAQSETLSAIGSDFDGTSPTVAPSIRILDSEIGATPVPKGAAAAIGPIAGGAVAFEAKHRGSSEKERTQRRQDILDTLGLYERDPEDPSEFTAYEQLKEEAAWLAQHPRP